MNNSRTLSRLPRARWLILIALLAAIFITGTLRNPDFWLTADQRGDFHMRRFDYALAAKNYTTPDRIAAAQYRDGDFENAAKIYARVPEATGAYNQGNALLMHGKYDDAIAAYTRALTLRPGWRDAIENRDLAAARKAAIESSREYSSDESTGTDKPDDIKFDAKGDDSKSKPIELTQDNLTDDQMRALWLRRVQTTPADFLRAKFAYQAATAEQSQQITNSNGPNPK